MGIDTERRAFSTLRLTGLHCAACAPTIEQALRALSGVEDAHVSGVSRRASVRWDPAQLHADDLIAAVRGAGYEAAADVPESWQGLRKLERRSTIWRLFVASFCAMQVMMMATPSYVARHDELTPDLRQLLNWGSWVLSVPVLWFAGAPYLSAAWRSFRRRQMSMDVPVALALLVTFLGSTVATFDPGGPLGDAVYFDSLTMFLAFLWLGRFLEMQARHRAEDSLQATYSELPSQTLRVLGDGRTESVALSALAVGDRVRVPLGAIVPADGQLLSPQALVSEALITGESEGVLKQDRAPVFAGSLNQGAPFDVAVERVGLDTRYAAIVSLMREAMTLRPEVARIADRWSGPFLLGVVVLSIVAAWAWTLIDPSRALWVAVAVLTVTCPCALSLALPATWTALAAGLARRGILLRRLDAIEPMAQMRQVLLDKTGTLTVAAQPLRDIQVWGVWTAAQALETAAGLARWSHHPVSLALVAAAQGQGQTNFGALESFSNVVEVSGAGVEGVDQHGQVWRLGKRDWACEADPGGTAEARHDTWLSCQGQRLAAFSLQEQVHPESRAAIEALRALGVGVRLISGDRFERVVKMAHRLGIDRFESAATPERKLQWVHDARATESPVGVVGDGVNDAPMLAAADVSFAMGQGAQLAQSSADAVLVTGNPMAVVWAMTGARRALTIARQNLLWALIYNIACIPLALLGWLPPWLAGLGMAASSTLVVLNAQRAARW